MPIFLCVKSKNGTLVPYSKWFETVATAYAAQVIDCSPDLACFRFCNTSPMPCIAPLMRKFSEDGVPACIALHLSQGRCLYDVQTTLDIEYTQQLAAAGAEGQILMTRACTNIADLPRGAGCQSLGRHLLQDLSAPQEILQLDLPELPTKSFPQLCTLSNSTTNLRLQTTPFIGRRKEQARLCTLLEQSDTRLLTLVGQGGIGKTRLALQAAACSFRSFKQGIHFVSIAPLESSQLLVPAIASAVKFSFRGRQEPKAQLLNYLRRKNLLLILDSFEMLTSAKQLLADILAAAPKIKILVTSREPVSLPEEILYPLTGLSYPGVQETVHLETFDAVQLYMQTTKRMHPSFAPSAEDYAAIAQICRLLEGMPLGIELAAIWTPVLSCKEIAEVIENNIDFLETTRRDIPKRHRSLRAVFDQSWARLTSEEQQTFARLSVFHGSFTLSAAMHIVETKLETLLSLVQKFSIRLLNDERFTLHQLLKQYAREKLHEDPEETARIQEKHARYYLQWLMKRSPALWTAEQSAALQELLEDLENLKAAWFWGLEHNEVTLLKTAGHHLYRLYEMRSFFEENSTLFQTAVATFRPRATAHPDIPAVQVILARLLLGQAESAYHLSKFEQAETLNNEVLDLLHRYNRPHVETFALLLKSDITAKRDGMTVARPLYEEVYQRCQSTNNPQLLNLAQRALGQMHYVLGNYAQTLDFYEKALAFLQQTGDGLSVERITYRMASVHHVLGNYQTAQRLFQEALASARQYEDVWGIANALSGCGVIAHGLGDYACAQEYEEACLVLRRNLGDPYLLASNLNKYGFLLLDLGEYDPAIATIQEALKIYQTLGSPTGQAFSRLYLGLAAQANTAYEHAEAYYRESLQLMLQVQDLGGIASCREALGALSLIVEREPEAEALFRESLHARQAAGSVEGTAVALRGLGDAALARENLEEAESLLIQALSSAVNIQAVPIVLQVLTSIARLRAAQGFPEQSLRWFSLILHHPATSKLLQPEIERWLPAAQNQLLPEKVTALLAEGQRLKLEAVVCEVLGKREEHDNV